MPTINFPANPSVNDTYTFGGKTWVWNGAAWQLQSQGGINNIPIGNSTPSTGAFTTLSSTGNTTLGNIVGNVLPAANVTYDLGSTSQRWNDIWLANSTIYLGEANISASGTAVVLPANTSVGGAVVTAVPKITGFDYPGDDTAADPAGGQTILINGANFESGCIVYIDNSVVSPVGFVNSTQLSITSPAKATGTYSVYVVNPDGSTALALPGIIYSGVPAWSTAAGNIGAPYETTAFATTLVATADSAVTYATAPGNSLPANLSLDSSTGNLSGTVPVANVDTTYTFSVRATDAELQDTDRQFSVTYRTDVVTWSAPANASSYTWNQNVANSVGLLATSAAGKAVSYAVQSGSLPANVSIAGNLISGTPTATQANTSVVVRATAATTNRFADQTLYFTVQAGAPSSVEYIIVGGGGGGGGGGEGAQGGGGGGGGGVRTGNLSVSTGTSYSVVVGSGGSKGTSGTSGNNGQSSSLHNLSVGGGGGGGRSTYLGSDAPADGGGGGGGGGEGYSGGLGGSYGASGRGGTGNFNRGGGGGSGGGVNGLNGGSSSGFTNIPGYGGDGTLWSDGNYYAGGGGGGGSQYTPSNSTPGQGGGGYGFPYGAGTNGATNTGGGGGGGSYSSQSGGNGGSGVVIIRYPDSFPVAAATTGSPTITTSGGYRYYKFTENGSITF